MPGENRLEIIKSQTDRKRVYEKMRLSLGNTSLFLKEQRREMELIV